MTQHDSIITALQNEIQAAQKKRNVIFLSDMRIESCYNEYVQLGGYIQGLNQALYLLTRQETVVELGY